MADLVILSNAIFTGKENSPFPGGVAVTGDKITAVGTKEEMKQYITADTVVKEYGDNLVMPGLCDTHGHYFSGAIMACEYFCDELFELPSEEACVQKMVEHAKKYPDLPRYFGYGWFPSYWGPDAKFPTKESLDKAFPDKPVYLRAADGHSTWVNSKALEESGYTPDWQPDFGSVEKLPNGELSGLLREHGAELTKPWATKLPDGYDKKLQKSLMNILNSNGITAFSELSAILPENIDEEYKYVKELDDSGEMTIRLYLYPGTDIEAERITELNPYREKYSTDTLKIAGVKGFIDGVTATFTAAMLEPYSDKPDDCGPMNKSAEQFKEWVITANRHGYGVRIHSIGDRATRTCLDCYEASNQVNDNSNIRNAVEHIEIISPEDIPRFAKLGVIASMQPAHLPLEVGEKLYRCGDRSRYEWALKSIHDTGAHIAFGTDYPVTTYDPFINIYAALTRKHKSGIQYGLTSMGEKMLLADILRSYTIEGAYANGMEEKTGSLEVGKYADIAVISKNFFTIPEDEILNCEAVLTVMNGKVVFEK